MKLSSTRAFVNQALAGLLVTIGFGGSVGLGTVWMRHQVSVLADTNRDLEQQYHDIERRIDDVNARVELELKPEVLRERNESMHLGLVELSEQQIAPVTRDPIVGLVAKANRRVFESEAVSTGIGLFTLPSASATTAAAPAGAPATNRPLNPGLPLKTPANRFPFAQNP
jgi:hypothetical protein